MDGMGGRMGPRTRVSRWWKKMFMSSERLLLKGARGRLWRSAWAAWCLGDVVATRLLSMGCSAELAAVVCGGRGSCGV